LGLALRNIGDVLGSDGRLFATLLVFGPGAETRLRRSIQAAGTDVLRLDDVTPALAERRRARACAANAMRRTGAGSGANQWTRHPLRPGQIGA